MSGRGSSSKGSKGSSGGQSSGGASGSGSPEPKNYSSLYPQGHPEAKSSRCSWFKEAPAWGLNPYTEEGKSEMIAIQEAFREMDRQNKQ